MNKQVFEYLKILGFTDDEINYIEEKNDNIVYANLAHIKKIIIFLQKLNLDNDSIKKICLDNVYMITETFRRINKLNDIYFEYLGFTTNEIKQLMIYNSNIYTINPNKLEMIIKYLATNNYNKEAIRNLILSNPTIVGMTLKEFQENVNI